MQKKPANDSYQYNLDPSGSESPQILKTETNATIVTDNNQQAKKSSGQASISPFMLRLIILFVMAVF